MGNAMAYLLTCMYAQYALLTPQAVCMFTVNYDVSQGAESRQQHKISAESMVSMLVLNFLSVDIAQCFYFSTYQTCVH